MRPDDISEGFGPVGTNGPSLIERLRELCAIEGRPLTVAERAESKIAMSQAAAALEAAREDAGAVQRVLAVVEEFEGCTAAGYRYMAANIREAIDAARGGRNG